MSSCFVAAPFKHEFFRLDYSTLTTSTLVTSWQLSEAVKSDILLNNPGVNEQIQIMSNSANQVFLATINSSYTNPGALTPVPTSHNGQISRMSAIDGTKFVTFGSLTTSTSAYKVYLVDFLGFQAQKEFGLHNVLNHANIQPGTTLIYTVGPTVREIVDYTLPSLTVAQQYPQTQGAESVIAFSKEANLAQNYFTITTSQKFVKVNSLDHSEVNSIDTNTMDGVARELHIIQGSNFGILASFGEDFGVVTLNPIGLARIAITGNPLKYRITQLKDRRAIATICYNERDVEIYRFDEIPCHPSCLTCDLDTSRQGCTSCRQANGYLPLDINGECRSRGTPYH